LQQITLAQSEEAEQILPIHQREVARALTQHLTQSHQLAVEAVEAEMTRQMVRLEDREEELLRLRVQELEGEQVMKVLTHQ
jgi:predicted transcriptional regulator